MITWWFLLLISLLGAKCFEWTTTTKNHAEHGEHDDNESQENGENFNFENKNKKSINISSIKKTIENIKLNLNRDKIGR